MKPLNHEKHARQFQLQLKKLYFHAFRSSDSARRVSMFSVHEFQEAACKLLPTSSLQNMNNVTSENCINELISGRILALWSLCLDAKCIEIFKPHKERITIPVAIGKNQLQKGLSLNLSKTFFVPISRYSTFTLFSFFFYHNRNGRTRKTLNGKTALKDLTAQRTLS